MEAWPNINRENVVLVQFLKFVLNGGVLGIVAWIMQLSIFHVVGSNTGAAYALAAALTYAPLIVINFAIQRTYIFKVPGLFWKFAIANFGIMLLGSALSPLCRAELWFFIGEQWANYGGFAVSMLICAIPSFLLKKLWVFSPR